MNFWIGTSGFQYAEWKGNFYPDDLATAKMLAFYAERFVTTEINYTFHRIPAQKTIENWKTQTSHFALRTQRPLPHRKRSLQLMGIFVCAAEITRTRK